MRCKACDARLKPSEIIYYPEHDKHEEFCKKCKDKFFSEYIKAGNDPDTVGRTALPEEKDDEDK